MFKCVEGDTSVDTLRNFVSEKYVRINVLRYLLFFKFIVSLVSNINVKTKAELLNDLQGFVYLLFNSSQISSNWTNYWVEHTLKNTLIITFLNLILQNAYEGSLKSFRPQHENSSTRK